MKAITLHQPWATLVAMKYKTIETRTHSRFASLNGQRIAIHAAKKFDPSFFSATCGHLPPMTVLQAQNIDFLAAMHAGQIVCTANVAAVAWAGIGGPNAEQHSDWNKRAICNTEGRFLLFLDDIRTPRKMAPFTGRQGIFNVPDELISETINQGGNRGSSRSSNHGE